MYVCMYVVFGEIEFEAVKRISRDVEAASSQRQERQSVRRGGEEDEMEEEDDEEGCVACRGKKKMKQNVTKKKTLGSGGMGMTMERACDQRDL